MNDAPAWRIVERRERATGAKHGTHSNYTMGCRCDPCHDAERKYQNERRRRMRERERRLELGELEECERCGKMITVGSSWMKQHREACGKERSLPLPKVIVTEKVGAEKIRPRDLLICRHPESDIQLGPLLIEDVKKSTTHVALWSHGKQWQVPIRVQFVRVVQSRKIEMRPDLRSNA